MIELSEHLANIDVQPAEYKRLLGYPPQRAINGRARELERWARRWYAEHGRPWIYARQARQLEAEVGSIVVDGTSFASGRLQSTLEQAFAESVVLVAVSAGTEIEQAAQAAWREGKPDEYFFLEVLGSAVVEHLTTTAGARLCAWADERGMAVLPHYSPGYPEWEISDQPRLLALIQQSCNSELPSRLDTLESGMLRPKKSQLAVFGLTRRTEQVRRITELVPCEACAYQSCQYRRLPYVPPSPASILPATAIRRVDKPAAPAPLALPLRSDARYAVNAKALKRWSTERLTMESRADGSIGAVFRYEGTTCTNLGRSLEFHYHVTLGPRAAGYPIQAQRCVPAPGDIGHTAMCRYLSDPESLMSAIDREKPLFGRPLDDVLAWDRPASSAGCYCELADRMHKWRLVLETIHFALVEMEQRQGSGTLVRAEVR
jgi:hypothetical protein